MVRLKLLPRGFALAGAFYIVMTASAVPNTSEWPQFRGPYANGVAEGQAIPMEFGPEKKLLWNLDLPRGHSSPCVFGDFIFLTGHAETTLKMVCVDRKAGKLAWQKERTIDKLPRYLHTAAGPANATPTTDGKRVYFVFDDYGVIATDFDGHVVWEKRLPPTANTFSYGASPIIHEGRLLLNRDGGLESSLLCLDAQTGDVVWRAERPKTNSSFSTPYLIREGASVHVLAGGSGRLQAYNAADGSVVWTVTGLPSFVCTSPVESDGIIYFGGWSTAHATGRNRVESAFEEGSIGEREAQSPSAFFERFDLNKDGRLSISELPESRGRDAFNFIDTNANGSIEFQEMARLYSDNKMMPGRNVLVSIRGGGHGDITESHVNWEITKGLPYVSSPLVYRGNIYLLKSGGYLSCFDATTGKPRYESQRLGVTGEYYATPVAVAGRIIVCAQRGSVLTLEAGEDFKILAQTELNDPICATPAIADNTLYIRSDGRLWAFRD